MLQIGRKYQQIIVAVLIVILVATNCITLVLYLKTFEVDEAAQIEEAGDELSRAKFFIKDWYDELSEKYGKVQVYFNELRFSGDTYTLTVAADRIRAVYPRGERFFQLEHITYLEFFTVNDHLSCRMYYDEAGELLFKLD